MRNVFTVAASVAIVGFPLIAGAVNIVSLPTNVSNVTVLLDRVCSIINLIFTILLIVAVIFIVLAAFTYITGGGDAENVSKASKQVLYAVVAVVVASFAKILPVVVSNFLGTGVSPTAVGC